MASSELPAFSFAPTFERAEEGRRGGSPATQSQQPLQVLSYQMPKFRGAPGRGGSPLQTGALVGSPMASAVLESVFRTVLGAGQDPASLMGSPIPSRNHDPGGLMGPPPDVSGRPPRSDQPPSFEGHIDTRPHYGGPGASGVDPAEWMLANFSDPESRMGIGDFYELMIQMQEADRRQRRRPTPPARNPGVQFGENDTDIPLPGSGGGGTFNA